MFQLILVPNNSGATACMYYTTKENADAAHGTVLKGQKEMIPSGIIELTDDFGYIIQLPCAHLSYSMLVDVVKSQRLAFEREMTIQQANAELMTDPRAAVRMPANQPQMRPSIITNGSN